MPRACSVCAHPERKAIDKALVAGETLRATASRYATSKDALSRHAAKCIANTLAKAADARRMAEAAAGERRRAVVEAETTAAEAAIVEQSGTTLEQVQRLCAEATRRLAEVVDDPRGSAALIASATRLLELQAKLLGELRSGTTVEIHTSPPFVEARDVILGALAPYPEALAAVVAALKTTAERKRLGGGR